MLDKAHYYHGAAIIRLLEDERGFSVSKKGFLGYVVNEKIFVFLKYTTKARTPWRFSFDQEDVDRCFRMSLEHEDVVLGLICGGDGVCALKWEEAKMLLDGKPGWICVKRNHNERYGVTGSASELDRKVAVGRWPTLLSETIQQKTPLEQKSSSTISIN